MLGKEWTREHFDEYVIWLEQTLFKILYKYGEKELQENIDVTDISVSQETVNESNNVHNDKECSNHEVLTFIRNKLNSLETVSKDEFIEYFLQSNNNKRYPKMAFLFDANYIDNCDMNQFYFSLLEKDGKIIIDQNDKIKGLKLLLSEFLYQCGYDSVLKIQESLLIKNIEKNRVIIKDKDIIEYISKDYN